MRHVHSLMHVDALPCTITLTLSHTNCRCVFTSSTAAGPVLPLNIEGYISPFEVSPTCYKVLAEDDCWITGVLTMEVGEKDLLHHHRDHLIYVEQGDGVTIYPGGNEDEPMVVPLQAGAGIPAPMSAPPFAKHTLLNSGTVPLKMVFFETKKGGSAPVSDVSVAVVVCVQKEVLLMRVVLYACMRWCCGVFDCCEARVLALGCRDSHKGDSSRQYSGSEWTIHVPLWLA